VIARVFAIMTFTAVSGSINFNFTTTVRRAFAREGDGRAGAVSRLKSGAAILFVIFSLASLPQPLWSAS